MHTNPGPHYTERGKYLYHVYVNVLLKEVVERDFIRKFFQGEPGDTGTCFCCGYPRKLIEGVFCLECTRESWVP